MKERNGSSTPTGVSQQQPSGQDLTPQRTTLNRSRLNQSHLLKQLNSPSVVGNEQFRSYATQQQQQPNQSQGASPMQAMPQFQQQLNSQGMQGHFQNSSMSGNANGGAFDQSTYMQLLQRQSSLNRSGISGTRPQSRGRVGGENIFQGQNQTLNFGDSSLLLSPNSQQNLGSKINLAAAAAVGPPPPSLQNCNGAPSLTKMNGVNWNDMSQQYPSQQPYVQQPVQQTSGNHRSNSQTGGSATQSFLNQTQNLQFDLMQQQHSQLGMYRNTSQPQLNLNLDQLQMIAQLLQNPQNQQPQQPQQPQPNNFGFQPQQPQQFDSQQLLQQLLFQQQQQQQQQQQNQAQPSQPAPNQNGPVASQLSQRQGIPAGMGQPNFPLSHQMQFHQPSHSQHFGVPAQQTRPQLQQISANVNEYRRLVENYKNSNNLVASNPNPTAVAQQLLQQQQPGTSRSKSPHPSDPSAYYGQQPPQSNQQVQPQQLGSQQPQGGNTSFEHDPTSQSQWQQQTAALPSYESFVQSQQFTLGGNGNGQKTGACDLHQQPQLSSNRPGLNTGRSAETGSDGFATAGRQGQMHVAHQTQFSQQMEAARQNDSYRLMNEGGGSGSGSQDTLQNTIAWPSRQTNNNPLKSANGSSGEKAGHVPPHEQTSHIMGRQQNIVSSSMPQFQSEEDNSTFLEGRAILGALNGGREASSGAVHGHGVGLDNQHHHQAPFGSKQLSPIQQNKKHDETENHSSFLKCPNDEVIISNAHDASQVVIGNTSKENLDQNDDSICWISQQKGPSKVGAGILSDHEGNRGSDQKQGSSPGSAHDDAIEHVRPKKLFSDGAPPPQQNSNGIDVDGLVIRKQVQTFEEMLESQLKKDPSVKEEKTALATSQFASATYAAKDHDSAEIAIVSVVNHANLTAEQQPLPVTPVKGENTSTQKKAFLRRGSSQKYDPQQARKQSQGSTKKFKYYSDNFQKRKGQVPQQQQAVAAAPKGTSGIPSLSVSKQPSQTVVQAAEDRPSKKRESPKMRSPKPLRSPKKTSTATATFKKVVSKESLKNLSMEQQEIAASPFKAENIGDASDLAAPKIIEQLYNSSPAPKTQRQSTVNQQATGSGSGRLKPPTERSTQNTSRLKFNAPASKIAKPEQSNEKDKLKKVEKAASTRNHDLASRKVSTSAAAEESKTTSAAAQKASSSRLAQSKQLFKKQNANAPKANGLKSMETKDPQVAQLPGSKTDELKVWGQSESDQPKEVPSMISDQASLRHTPHVRLESSMCDEREDSFIEKNSIAEFEMLEKECFQDEAASKPINLSKQIGAKSRKSSALDHGKRSSGRPVDHTSKNGARTGAGAKTTVSIVDKNQISHNSPVRKHAREILNNLKSCSTEKQSSYHSDESKIEKLENQLMALIAEQEYEVARLKEENTRVAVLQSECQRQLERLNKEVSEQERSKKSVGTDVKKLKNQLKQKEEEIIRLQEDLLGSQEQNQKLKTSNQTLTCKLDKFKSKNKEASKETQTDKTPVRHIMVGTSPVPVDVKEIQVELLMDVPEIEQPQTPTEKTPEKENESHLTLENERSMPVSPEESVLSISQQQCTASDFSELIINTALSARKLATEEGESCDVLETDAARGAEVVKSARSAIGMPQASMQAKSAKVVTFDLDGESSTENNKQLVATTQSRDHEQADNSKNSCDQELTAQLIDEDPSDGLEGDDFDDEDDEVEEEEYDLVFPEAYHSDEAYKNLIQIEEVVSAEGKRQKFYECGKKEIIFPNGVKREVWPDGYQVVFFQNQDIKQTFPGGKIVYFFSEAKTTQTTFPDSLQVFKFQNNQIEKHFPDGTKEISFPDGTIKCLFADGEEESIFPDGTIQKIEKSGLRIIEYSHGQRDYMYPDGTKVREYPNGLIKRYNLDGSVETIQQHDMVADSTSQELSPPPN